MKYIHTYIILLIGILLSFSHACKKENHCSPNLAIEGPNSVIEGEDIHLSVSNLTSKNEANNYFYWKFANMTGYNYQVGDMVEVSDPSPVIIENADIRDDGKYAFKVTYSDGSCQSATVTKYITVIPKTCPCYNTSTFDTLAFDESFSSGTSQKSCTYHSEVNSTDFTINTYVNLYSLNFYFNIPVPTKSSTYSLTDYYYTSTYDIDPVVQARVWLSYDMDSYDAYILSNNSENLYVKIEGNYIILSVCDLEFKHTSIPNRTVKITGKMKIAI